MTSLVPTVVPVYSNLAAAKYRFPASQTEIEEQVLDFHKTLPYYGPTPLLSLPNVAKELGLTDGHVLLKDESSRFGLPSFKILGASWAVYHAVLERLKVLKKSEFSLLQNSNAETKKLSLSELGQLAELSGISLVTCTEGNWGRAVARMAKYMGMRARIFVPSFMPETTRNKIGGESEKVEVIVVDGNYDDCVAIVRQECENEAQRILVMDMGWQGYQDCPEVS
jgi:diaminopropionate ammonia-lyase